MPLHRARLLHVQQRQPEVLPEGDQRRHLSECDAWLPSERGTAGHGQDPRRMERRLRWAIQHTELGAVIQVIEGLESVNAGKAKRL